ncbi:MAG: DUF1905 domain-containing protein [Saprospiraceae bacterium]|nr:DUF1905 domain-containing protein [Saprospiraceae bacterium]
MIEKPIVDNQYLVKKRAAKSGFKYSEWTYVVIPAFPPEKKTPLGTVRVSGFIDTYELKQYHLLPMKEGNMCLPLKAAVRKKIGKGEGDFVHVILFLDDSPLDIPDEILACLLDSPKAYRFFLSLSSSNQKYYLDWIEDTKKMETKVARIAKNY